MPYKSSETFKAISLEIGRAPKMAFLDKPNEIPAVPEGPIMLIIDLERPNVSHRQSIDRLADAVNALIHNKPIPGIIQASKPESFNQAYLKFLDDKTSALLYTPDDVLSQKDLTGVRSMLEYFGYPAPSVESRAPNSSIGTALDAARQRRAQLLEKEHWLNAGQVHQQQQGGSPSAPGANNTASRLRRRGELLGAWDGHEYLHPVFQFDQDTGRVMPEMKELLAILPKDQSGWRQVFWLFQPHALFDGQRPGDVFQADPLSVIEAARSAFEPGNTNW